MYSKRITVKFDYIEASCDKERVRRKFMVSKNHYVHPLQFPLMLAYAVTIHKCQGLSLECVIVDL